MSQCISPAHHINADIISTVMSILMLSDINVDINADIIRDINVDIIPDKIADII